MRPRIRPTAFYIIFTLCVVLAVNSADSTGQKVSAISNSLSNEGNSSGDLNKTGSSNNLFATGSSQTEAVSLSTLKQNPTSSNMNSLAPETTVATSTNSMKPSVPDSSQSPLTQKTTVQTTLPHVSGHYMPESSVTSTLGLRATESQISSTRQVSTSISTPILKPTQTESTGTSRQPTITDVTQPYTGSLYSILTTGTSGTGLHLRKQEIILTICLSTILGVVILTIIMYNVTKCKRRRAQYSHRPLYASSYEEPGAYHLKQADTSAAWLPNFQDYSEVSKN
ncbi:sialomucin core protein 24-like isoform X2 [Carcharodon carcharias]|uniref:sialomucin core protein 24-like isoform X2 n=1 Tax=Carcharodon carcharias TaxID=13397 RepID=UPI001B7F3686|nr:sialomucin core protein 24-like isoform X2 [Carcharodon carcharias]